MADRRDGQSMASRGVALDRHSHGQNDKQRKRMDTIIIIIRIIIIIITIIIITQGT
jgi:hypothetical protein